MEISLWRRPGRIAIIAATVLTAGALALPMGALAGKPTGTASITSPSCGELSASYEWSGFTKAATAQVSIYKTLGGVLQGSNSATAAPSGTISVGPVSPSGLSDTYQAVGRLLDKSGRVIRNSVSTSNSITPC